MQCLPVPLSLFIKKIAESKNRVQKSPEEKTKQSRILAEFNFSTAVSYNLWKQVLCVLENKLIIFFF